MSGANRLGRPAAGVSLTSPPCPWASLGHPGHSSIHTSCRPTQISPCCIWWLLPTPAILALTERPVAGPQRPRSLQNKERLTHFIQLCNNGHPYYPFFAREDVIRHRLLPPPNMQDFFLIISPLSWTNMSASTKTQGGWINCRIKHQTASDSAIWTFLDCFYLLWFNRKYTDDKAQSCQKVFLTFSSSVFICPTAALSLLK